MSFDLPDLPEGWNYKSLEDCARKQSISYGVVQPGTALADGIPIIRVNNFNDGRIELADLMKISPEIETKYSRTRLVGGEVLITLVGSVGQVAVAPVTVAGFNVARAVAVIHPIDGISPSWIAICLRSPLSQHLLVSRANTTVQTTINLKDLRALPLPIPPKEERDQVESLITTLDDRIALLRETNATLEAMAQALFKSWFVDFDPVHANAGTKQMINPASSPSDFVGDPAAPLDSRLRGNDDLLPPELQTLFPATFTASPQGLVPEGWSRRALDEIAEYLNGLALQKFPPTGENDLPVIKIAQLRKGDTVGADLAGRNIKPEYIVQDGDVLFSWSGSLEVEIWCGGEGALNQHLFKVTSKEYPKWFYYLWTSYHLANFKLIAASKATTMGHIQRKHLTEAMTVVPSVAVLNAANEAFNPMIEQLINNALQIRNLATLRDTLLPRLISGQLRLPEAEAALAEVV
jgi:type I restriction enzyme, S subunit